MSDQQSNPSPIPSEVTPPVETVSQSPETPTNTRPLVEKAQFASPSMPAEQPNNQPFVDSTLVDPDQLQQQPQPLNNPDLATLQQQAQAQQLQQATAPVAVEVTPTPIINPKPIKNRRITHVQITEQTQTILTVAGLVLLLLLSLNGFGLYLINNKAKELQTARKQIITTQQNSGDLANAVDFLDSFKTQNERIKAALPNESGLVNFVEAVEAVADSHATNNSLEFTALAPTGTTLEKYIPLIITLTTDEANFEAFLIKIEKLPYLLEVSTIETDTGGLPDDIMKIKINARVYVQDPFTKG